MGVTEKRHRVLLLTQYFAPEITAGAFRMTTLQEYLLGRGYDVDVITAMPRKNPVGLTVADVRVHRVMVTAKSSASKFAYIRNYASFFWRSSWLAVKMHGYGADVILASSPPITVALGGALISAFLRKPLLLDVRDLWPDSIVDAGKLQHGSLTYRCLVQVERASYRKANHLFTVSQPMRDHVLSRGGTKVDVVYNGVPFSDLQYARQLPLQAQPEEQCVSLFYAGNLGLVQDFQFLWDALPVLAERYKGRLTVHLIGSGALAGDCQAAAQAFPTVMTVEDAMPRTSLLARLRREATLMLVPLSDGAAMSKTIPSKVFDCLLLQKPVLYHLTGEGESIFKEAQCGARFELNAQDFLRALDQVLTGLRELSQAAQENSLRVLARYVREDQYQTIDAAIEKAVSGGGRHERGVTERNHNEDSTSCSM